MINDNDMESVWHGINERKKKVDFNENMFDNKNNTHSLFELNILRVIEKKKDKEHINGCI